MLIYNQNCNIASVKTKNVALYNKLKYHHLSYTRSNASYGVNDVITCRTAFKSVYEEIEQTLPLRGEAMGVGFQMLRELKVILDTKINLVQLYLLDEETYDQTKPFGPGDPRYHILQGQ